MSNTPHRLRNKRLAGVKTLRPIRLDIPQQQSSRRYQTGDRPWRKLREVVLHRWPLCGICGEKPSTDVDHRDVDAWNNDLEDNLWGLCHECHAKKTQTEDISALPLNLQPSAADLTIVCGPPGSGKTSFCRKSAQLHDLVIDFDEILSGLTRKPIYTVHSKDWYLAALRERNRQLRLLKDLDGGRAFFTVTAPTLHERNFWRESLEPARVIVMETSLSTCVQRLQADLRRQDQWPRFAEVARNWWTRYAACDSDQVITEG